VAVVAVIEDGPAAEPRGIWLHMGAAHTEPPARLIFARVGSPSHPWVHVDESWLDHEEEDETPVAIYVVGDEEEPTLEFAGNRMFRYRHAP
jgi:hypothetical protein